MVSIFVWPLLSCDIIFTIMCIALLSVASYSMAASRRASLKKQGEFVFLISVANYSIAVNTTVPLKKQDAFVFLISLASYARVSPKKQDGFAFFDRCSFRFDVFLSCRCCIYSLIYVNVASIFVYIKIWMPSPGADPGFQVRGDALKNCFGVFRGKNHDFTPKKSYFFQF